MSLIEKIDAEILCIKKVLVPGTFTEEVYGTLMGKLQMAERIKEIILAKQKESCEYCEDGVYHDILGSPCKYNYCPMCGRPLNQSPGEPKPLTKGDKIRESNESLARCIYKFANCENCNLYNIECAMDKETCVKRLLDDYLNQPYTE